MSVRIGTSILLGLLAVSAGEAAQTPSPTQEVRSVVRTLFDGMREKDESKLRAVWHAEARLQTPVRDREGERRLSTTAVEDFVLGVLAADARIDEVTFDEVVRVDGDLAMVWAPYNLFVDDEFRHCGVDAFLMVRSAAGWRILQLTDTRTRGGCDPSRRKD